MNPDLYTTFLHRFNGVINGLKMYPTKHPANLTLHKTLWDTLQQLFQHQQILTIGVIDQTLFIHDQLYTDDNPAAKNITRLLEQYQINGIEITAGLHSAQLQTFIEIFSQGQLNGSNIDTVMNKHGINNIHHINTQDDGSGGNLAMETYGYAKQTLEQVCNNIRMDHSLADINVMPAVEKMIRQTVKTPYAMLALSMIKDYDDYTYGHSVNVSVIALAIGRACQLSDAEMYILGMGSLLHDIGKLKIDPNIIKKPGQLSAAEYEQIKLHPELGARIAAELSNMSPRALDIIHGHHRHYNRHGYPADIPDTTADRLVDIATVADTYDAITTLRVYRQPSTPRYAIQIMKNLVGKQLHPHYFNILEKTLGTFPVGSVVRLFNNEIGVVIDMDALDNENSTIRILKDGAGNTLAEPYDLHLTNSSNTIAGEVDSLIHNINIVDVFAAH